MLSLFCKGGDTTMVQINLTVDYKGNFYHTNVITSRDASDEEVMQLAISQVKRQWKI